MWFGRYSRSDAVQFLVALWCSFRTMAPLVSWPVLGVLCQQAAQPERRIGWIGQRQIVRRRPVSFVRWHSRFSVQRWWCAGQRSTGSWFRFSTTVQCPWARGMLGRMECSRQADVVRSVGAVGCNVVCVAVVVLVQDNNAVGVVVSARSAVPTSRSTGAAIRVGLPPSGRSSPPG